MKIFNWNCNRGVYKKLNLFIEMDFELSIIQECENLKELKSLNPNYNQTWIGDRNGLGIIWKNSLNIKFLNWKNYELDYYIPMIINNDILIIALWAHGNYIEDIYVYFSIYYDEIKKFKKVLIIGDFNSSVKFDNRHKKRSHTDFLNKMKKINITSAYHSIYNCSQGDETTPTFYMYKKLDKPYHIDYVFSTPNLVKNLTIGDCKIWLKYSDHMPLYIEILT